MDLREILKFLLWETFMKNMLFVIVLVLTLSSVGCASIHSTESENSTGPNGEKVEIKKELKADGFLGGVFGGHSHDHYSPRYYGGQRSYGSGYNYSYGWRGHYSWGGNRNKHDSRDYGRSYDQNQRRYPANRR